MNVELRPLLDYGLEPSVDLMNLGFSDYFIHIELSLPMFLNMVRVDGIDLGSSRVIYVDEQAAGVALIARRGWTSRLAAMCLAPASRGRGAGRAAMEVLLADASARRDRSMVLEVIEANAPGVRLYESCGFRIERRLVGFEGSLTGGKEYAGLEEVDIREVATLVTAHSLENLPWQISGESLAQSGSPNIAFRLEEAYIVLSNPEADQIAIRSIIVKPEGRQQGQATRLLKAALTEYPNKKWLVPAFCPEEIGGLFEKTGFTRGALSQYQMRIELSQKEEN